MRWFILILLSGFIFLPNKTIAQNVIMTIAGDSIACQVVETNDRFIYYRTAATKRGKVEVISRKQVSGIYASMGEVSTTVMEKDPKEQFERWSFFGSGGLSWLAINRLEDSDDFDDYYQSLQWGRWYGFGASYMLDRTLGIGVLFNRSRFGSDEVGVQAQNGALIGVLREDVTIDYAAINLIYRLKSDHSGSGLTLSGGIGITRYRNDMEFFYPFYLEGQDVGIHARGIYRLSISPGICIPIELGVRGITVGTINITPDNAVPDNLRNPLRNYISSSHPANIGRVEVGVGLEISF